MIAGARGNRVGLGDRQLADRLKHQVAVLSSIEASAVAVVDEVGVLRVELEADVIITVCLLAFEVNAASDSDARLDHGQALRMIDMGVGITGQQTTACGRARGGQRRFVRAGARRGFTRRVTSAGNQK